MRCHAAINAMPNTIPRKIPENNPIFPDSNQQYPFTSEPEKKIKQNKQIKTKDTQMNKARKFKKQTHQSSQNRNLLLDLRKGSQSVNLVKMGTNWDKNCKRHQNLQLKDTQLLFYFNSVVMVESISLSLGVSKL